LAGFGILTVVIMGIIQGSVFVCTFATLIIGALMLLISDMDGPAVSAWEWGLGFSLIAVWLKPLSSGHRASLPADHPHRGPLIDAFTRRGDHRPSAEFAKDVSAWEAGLRADLLKEAEARVIQRQAAEAKRLMADPDGETASVNNLAMLEKA
jgi:hypothetical protein